MLLIINKRQLDFLFLFPFLPFEICISGLMNMSDGNRKPQYIALTVCLQQYVRLIVSVPPPNRPWSF